SNDDENNDIVDQWFGDHLKMPSGNIGFVTGYEIQAIAFYKVGRLLDEEEFHEAVCRVLSADYLPLWQERIHKAVRSVAQRRRWRKAKRASRAQRKEEKSNVNRDKEK
ncbi:MAG: hypothetical protein HY709_08905, partial [Candidatus Latescibacteria bacterium]|nr:hypothetical protein [Candidatus Latescibacterota bacterium]